MGVNSLPKTANPTASRLRFEPGPFCAWVQHANHSATEPPLNYASEIIQACKDLLLDLLKSFHPSFLKSILVPSAIVLLNSMVLTTTSKPTFLPWSLFDYFVLLLAILYEHMIMYVPVVLFGHSAVVFHVFMFYWLFVWLCFFSDALLLYSAV